MSEVDIPYPKEVVDMNVQLADMWEMECRLAWFNGLDGEQAKEVAEALGTVQGRADYDQIKWNTANKLLKRVQK